MQLKRKAEKNLAIWLNNPARKPLVIRGARQVGKSTLVQNFAASRNLRLNEVNLERHHDLAKDFASFDMERIVQSLSAVSGRDIREEGSLLFLDEIQAVPEALACLRYFKEEMPGLPVVTAGSLLEFALEKKEFRMPVGRVEYLFLHPMTFLEFLAAVEPYLAECIEKHVFYGQAIASSVHGRIMLRLRQYMIVGGMPEAVSVFCEENSLEESGKIQGWLLTSYNDDFSRYARNESIQLLESVMRKLPAMACRKVKYVNFDRDLPSRNVKKALDLLAKARIFSKIVSSRCNGVPLLADADLNAPYKPLFLDIGLMNHACGLDWRTLSDLDETALVNEGTAAEQFVGQELLAGFSDDESSLAYWLRENRGSNAEVDFVTTCGPKIVPVEVKAGKSGTMRSLGLFVASHSSPLALRFDANPPSRQTLSVSAAGSKDCQCELVSLPLYLAGNVQELLKALL